MNYMLTLRTEEDYRMIKKLLKAFEGTSITPISRQKSQLEKSLEEIRNGQTVGTFTSVKDFMENLLS